MLTHTQHIRFSPDAATTEATSRENDKFIEDLSRGLPDLRKAAETTEKPAAETTTEKPAETTTTAATTTTTEPPIDEDLANFIYGEDEPPVTTTAAATTTTTATTTEPDNTSDDIKRKAQAYDQLTQSETYKLIDSFASSGKKDINEFVKNIAGDDVSGKSFDELYEMHLNSLGVSTESKQRLLEKFKEKEYEDQELEIIPIRAQLNNQRNEKLSQFLSQYKPQSQVVQNEIPEPERIRLQALIDEGRQTVDKMVGGMTGKNFLGLQVSEEMATSIKERMLANPYPIMKDGKVVGYDLEASRRAAIAADPKMFKALLKATSENSRTAGWDEFVTKRNKPSKENTATSSAPIQKTKADDIKQASDEAYKLPTVNQPKFGRSS